MINQFKSLFFFLYFIVYSINCAKSISLPIIKDKNTIFFNEWLNITPYVYKNIFNSTIHESGDFITSDKIDIVVSNHINKMDFLMISSIIKQNTKKNIVPIVNKDITKIPFIQSFTPSCIIVDKDFGVNSIIIKNFLKNIDNCIIIICPEVEMFDKKNIVKSHEFSDKNNLKKYNNLLYPRMRELNLLINELNKSNKLGNLIDLTIKINDKFKFKTGYLDYFKGNLKDLYCNINSYNINNKCFNNYDNFKKWYLMIWDDKEEYLNNHNIYKYIIKKYQINTSTFILNIIFLSLIIYNLNMKNNLSLIKKKI